MGWELTWNCTVHSNLSCIEGKPQQNAKIQIKLHFKFSKMRTSFPENSISWKREKDPMIPIFGKRSFLNFPNLGDN